MKSYTIIGLDGSYQNIKKSYKPKNSLGETPIDPMTGEPEDSRWLQLENIDDGNGNMIPTVTVDDVLKAQIQADDLQKQLDNEATKAAEKAAKDAKKKLLKDFKKTDVTDLDSIKDALFNIIDYLKDLDDTIDKAK